MIYLASPYNHASPFVREQRYLAAMEALSILLKRRMWTFSPIVHCHELKKVADLPPNFDFWLEYDFHVLDICSALYVLNIAGWSASIGVGEECRRARERNIPISLVRVIEGELDFLPMA